MNDITPKEAIEILSHYTDLGYGVVIEGEDTSKIKQALFLANKTLANGTPYNPTGDCISRKALKEDVSKVVAEERKEDEKWAAGLRYALKLIDNAPPVEPERPQGEWLTTTKENIFGEQTECFECSICHKAKIPLMNVLIHEKIPICPNCGADMKGGAE